MKRKLTQFYNDYNVKERLELTMEMLGGKASSFPCLSGPAVKGANVRPLLPWLVLMCREYNDGSRQHHRRVLMAEGLAAAYEITRGADLFFSEDEKDRFAEAVHKFSINYHYLAMCSCRDGRILYNIVTKHHYFQHMAQARKTVWKFCVENGRTPYRSGSIVTKVS